MSDLASKLRKDNDICAQVVQLCRKCFDKIKNQDKCRFCKKQNIACSLDSSQVTVMCKNCYDSSKTRCQDCGRARCIFSFSPPHKTIVIVVADWDTHLAMKNIVNEINKGCTPFPYQVDDEDHYYLCV